MGAPDIKGWLASIAANTAKLLTHDTTLGTLDTRLTDVEKTKISMTSPKYNFKSFIPSHLAGQQLESLAYVKADDVILAASKWYTQLPQDVCSIIKYDRKTMSVISTYDNLPLCHASDMTYNPNTKELFISTSTDPRAANYISVYDYTTMSFKREFQYAYKDIVYGIAYNNTLNQFVFYDDNNIRICDSNMVSLSYFTVPNPNGYNYQNIEVYGNYVLLYYDTAIMIYDLKGNNICEYAISDLDEGEGMVYVGNDIFYIGRVLMNHTPLCTQRSARIYEFNITQPAIWDYNRYISKTNSHVSSKTGTVIPGAVAYDRMSISDMIIMNSGTYTLGSNAAGAYDYFPDGGNENKAVAYNSTNTELVFSSTWDFWSLVSADSIYQGGLHLEKDWAAAKNLANADIQFDYYTGSGLELGLCIGGLKTNPNTIALAKLTFKWDFYVRSLNV